MEALVGIDFSLNSPAFCILKENKLYLSTLTRSDRDEVSYCKNKKKPFYLLSGLDMVNLYFMNKEKIPDSYVEKERIKIHYFRELVDEFWNYLFSFIKDCDSVKIAIEGISFGSPGNALIDISMATALLRDKVVNVVGLDNFYVYSPATVKKFAYKGNAKKYELYDAIISKKHETNLSDFTKMLYENKHEWITKSGAVNKPVDDIIDSIWVCLYLENELKNK